MGLGSVCGVAFVPVDLLVGGFATLGLGRGLEVNCIGVFSCFVSMEGRWVGG
jgi:hypothetical protein